MTSHQPQYVYATGGQRYNERMSMETPRHPIESDPMLPVPPRAVTHVPHSSLAEPYPSPTSPAPHPSYPTRPIPPERDLPPVPTPTNTVDRPDHRDPKNMSQRLYHVLWTKPKLSKTWEKKSFADELEGIRTPASANVYEAADTGHAGFPPYLSPRGRPTSLYASPAEYAAFRPLPMVEEGDGMTQMVQMGPRREAVV